MRFPEQGEPVDDLLACIRASRGDHADWRGGRAGHPRSDARLEKLGATRVGEGSLTGKPERRWVVMTDPEDNEFCVCGV